nr:hypothetical protein [Tanacetum cinerariifolium]
MAAYGWEARTSSRRAPALGPLLTASSLLAAPSKAREDDERNQESRQGRPDQIMLKHAPYWEREAIDGPLVADIAELAGIADETMFENAFKTEFKERMQKYTGFNAQSFQNAMIFVIQNTCSDKEDSNSETASSKSVKESSLDSATKDVHAIKYKMSKSKEKCMAYFQSLHSHLQVLFKEDLKGTLIEHRFKRAFMSLFGQDADTFTSTCFSIQMTDKYFVEYTGIELKHFKDTLLQHMGNVKKSVVERTRHQRQYDRRVNKGKL